MKQLECSLTIFISKKRETKNDLSFFLKTGLKQAVSNEQAVFYFAVHNYCVPTGGRCTYCFKVRMSQSAEA